MKGQNSEEEAKREEAKQQKSLEISDSGEETQQQKSFAKEQTEYWKSFVSDLFVGTLKRMIVFPLVFGLAFLATFYLIYKLSIKPQELFILLKILEVLIVFVLYFLVGIVSGLVHGANSTLLKKVEGLERGVHLIVNPLMAAIIERMPGGQKSISIDEFNELLDDQLKRFKRTSRLQFRFFSLVGVFSRFFLRIILRILRYILLHDLLEGLREKGETQINAKAVETYHREKLIAVVVDILRGKLEFVQYGVYGVLILFLAIPIVFMVVF